MGLPIASNALELLATDVLPRVEGASLPDLRVVAGHLSPRPLAIPRL
jgi:hypothetical protein